MDGNQREQRVPLQVLVCDQIYFLNKMKLFSFRQNVQPQSVVWGRTDGSALPANVVQDGNDLVFRNPSSEQAGNYICTITHPDGLVDRINIYVEYRPGQFLPARVSVKSYSLCLGQYQPQPQPQPYGPGYGYPVFSPASPLNIAEGTNQLIQPQGVYYNVQWRRDGGQSLPSGVYQNGNALQITNAQPDQSGTYYCDIYGADGIPINVPYEIRVRAADRPQPSSGKFIEGRKKSFDRTLILFQVVHQESVLSQKQLI